MRHIYTCLIWLLTRRPLSRGINDIRNRLLKVSTHEANGISQRLVFKQSVRGPRVRDITPRKFRQDTVRHGVQDEPAEV